MRGFLNAGMNRLTTAYPTNAKGAREFAATDRPPGEVLFRRARRHSRRVRLLRILIPIILLAGAVVSTLIVWLNPLRLLTDLPVSIGRLSISGTKMTMTEPKLSGFTRDQRHYELTANAAAQDAVNIDVVNLDEPRATLEMSDRSMVMMRASAGIFDRKAGLLQLRRDIVLTSTSGYEIRLQEADIDVRNGNIVSEQPVEVNMQQGTLKGNRLEVTKSGEVIRFDGGVTMTLIPQAADFGFDEKQTTPQ